MSKAIGTGVLMGAILYIFTGNQAFAKDGWSLRPKAKSVSVPASRIGLIDGKVPLIGARMVYRGGYSPIRTMVRPRFVGGMVDIYPSTTHGFRFSVGTRYYARPNFWIAAEQATGGVLYDPHMTRGGRGLVRNFRRYTPTAMVGYDISPANGLVLGIESGALAGRAIPTVRTPRMGFARSDGGNSGLNEVVTMSARLAF